MITLCAYCGVRPTTTQDHVIPRCLFTRPLPQQMITVPACEECNREKQPDDTYLRDMLVSDVNASEHPTARSLLHGPVQRSAKLYNSSDVAHVARTQARWEEYYTPAGLYVGHGRRIPMDTKRVDHLFARIVRGLYYYVTGERLPADCRFDVRGLHPLYMDEEMTLLNRAGCNGPFSYAGGVFGLAFVIDGDQPYLTRWLLRFYDGIYVTVHTEPPPVGSVLS